MTSHRWDVDTWQDSREKCHQERERMHVRREWRGLSEESDVETEAGQREGLAPPRGTRDTPQPVIYLTGGFLFGDDKVP